MKRSLTVVAAASLALLVLPDPAFAQPTNDDFDAATVIGDPLPFRDTISTLDATTAPDDPAGCGPVSATVWYSYTPSASGVVVIDAFGSSYETVVAVYTGTRGALDVTRCEGDHDVSWSADAGTTYYVLAGSHPGETGGQLSLAVSGEPTIDVTLDRVGHVDPHTGIAVVSGTLVCTAEFFDDIGVRGSLSQRAGRLTISGFIGAFPGPGFRCDGTLHRWTADVQGDNGTFTRGKASAWVVANICVDAVVCADDLEERTIRLRR